MRAGSKLFGNHRALLSSAAGVPAWVVNGSNPPDIAFDFTNSRAWKKSGGTLSASSQLTCSRASVGYVNDASGNWTSVASNLPRISNLGLLVEESRTNQIRNNSMTGAMVMADGVELLTNTTLSGSGLVAASWTVNAGSGAINFTPSSGVQITGDGTTFNTYVAQQLNGLVIGREYVVVVASNAQLSAWVGTSAGDQSVMAHASLIGNGNTSAVPDRVGFIATATSLWVSFGKQGATPTTLTAVSVQDGERVQNGGFTSSPLNASPTTVQNGWMGRSAPAGVYATNVTYAGTTVTLTSDGTNTGQLNQAIPTVIGVTYTVTFDLNSSCSVNASTAAYGAGTLNAGAVFTSGVGQKFQFTATATTTHISFSRGAPNTGSVNVNNVSVQSAGQLPTNWGIQATAGLRTNIVGMGTESGIDYIDVQTVGTANSTLYQLRLGEGPSQIAVLYGQTLTQSVFLKQVGGTYTNISNFILCAFEYTAGTGFLTSDPNTTNMSAPGTNALGTQRVTNSFTVTSPTAAFVMPALQFNTTNASAINLTLRIGWPQLEGIPIGSSVASAVTAASGASGVNGTAVYQVGGGTGTAATLNCTWAAGVLTVNSVAAAGSYSVLPPSPAALTYVSGTATGWTGATVTLTPTNNAANAFASSPIRTTSATANRAGDVVTMTTPPAIGAAYTLYAKGNPIAPAAYPSNQVLFGIDDGTFSNALRIWRPSGSNAGYQIRVSGTPSGTGSTGWSTGVTGKLAVAAAVSDQTAYFGGISQGTSTTNPLPAGMNAVVFGNTNGSGQYFNGFIAEAALWASQRLSNAQLTAITTIAPSVDLNFAAGAYTGVSGSPSSFLTTSRASTGYVNDSLGNLTLVGSNLPRISDLGLLIEEGRTNLAIRSQEFDNTSAWGVPSKASTSPNTTTAPDGTLTADSLIEDGTSGEHYIQQTIATQVNVPNTFSVYAKAGTGTGRYINLQLFDSTVTANFSTVTVDLSSGTPSAFLNSGAAGSASVVVTPCVNGWYRIAVTTTLASVSNTGIFFRIRRASANGVSGAQTSYAGDGSSFTYLWGAQLEANTTFATSYIPTTTASAVRAADNVSLTTLPSFGSAYSLFAKGTPQAPTTYAASNQIIASISAGATYGVGGYKASTTGNAAWLYADGGHGITGTPVWAQGVSGKIAVAGTVNDQAAAFNNVNTSTQTNGTAATVPTQVLLGSYNTSSYWDGFVERIQIWPNNRIPNAQLQTVTT